MGIEGTIVVEFGESVASDQQFTVVELDDAVNVDTSGNIKTSFNPDDTPGFVVHYDETQLCIDRVECSSGSVSAGSLVSRTRTRQLQFTNTDDSQELSHIPDGDVDFEEYGNSPAIVQDGRKIRAAGQVPAIGEATYSIRCRAYRLNPPTLTLEEDETYPILVVVYMEAV